MTGLVRGAKGEVWLEHPVVEGECDLELDLGRAIHGWSAGFDAGKRLQRHIYAVPTEVGPRILLETEIWNQ